MARSFNIRPLTTDYRDELRLFPDSWHKVGLVLLALVILGFLFFANTRWLGLATDALVAIVGASALMILTGFCGQVSLGHAAFLGLGAYTAGVFGQHLEAPFWLALPAAGLVSAAIGLMVGPLALRLHGLYLAIVTLGLTFIVQHVLLSLPDLTGGAAGLAVPMHTGFGKSASATDFGDFWNTTTIGSFELVFEQKLYLVFLGVAVAIVFMTKNLARSRTGRAMMAVRDHDLAAAVLGVDPTKTKLTAFFVSSFFAGIAGAMYAMKAQFITVAPPFDLFMSIEFIAMIVLGGIGTTFGAVWGAVAFVFLKPVAHAVGAALPFLSTLTSNEQERIIFALLILGFLLFEPLGLVGLWLRVKRYFLAWPFRY
ncbi:MAG TPA: branched-chain amino acid ABC transporter permease [Myxococcota bacterium]|nr:branched-chain amino acid ABC transporter permease [Myxococcota bacterium]